MDKINVVEFVRVSTLEQADDDREGIPRQKYTNSQTVKIHNLNVIKSIELVDVSGASVDQTPEFHELLQLVERGKIKGIVVSEWDRLLRMIKYNQLSFVDILKENNVKIYTSTRVIDFHEEWSDFLTIFESLLAGKEREKIKKRIHESKELKRKNGEHPNNLRSLPLGVTYDRELGMYKYTNDAFKVKMLFDLFVIERIQNYQELGEKTGIHPRNVINLLRNKLYIGIREYTEKRSDEIVVKINGRQGDKKKIKRNPDEIIRNKVIDDPLIEESIFEQAQEIVNNKKNEYDRKKSQSREDFIYRGFLYCGDCGQKMYSSHGGKTSRDYYVCRTKKDYFIKKHGKSKCSSPYLRKSNVENWINSFVSEKLSEKEYLVKLIDIAITSENKQDVEQEIKTLNNALKKIDSKRKRLLDLYKDKIFEKEELYKEIEPLNDDKIRVTRIIDTLQKRRGQSMNIKDLKKKIVPLAVTLSEYTYWTTEQKRELLRIQFPEFHISSTGITSCKVNFCNFGNRMDKG